MPTTPDQMSDWFWDIIARADKDQPKLNCILRTLSNDELYRFALEFKEACGWLQYGPCNSYLKLSEDGDEDMSCWVVSQGKDYYSRIVEHPEAIVAFAEAGYRTLGFEGTAEEILAERLGDDVWDDIWNEHERFVESEYTRVADYWDALKQKRQQLGQRQSQDLP